MDVPFHALTFARPRQPGQQVRIGFVDGKPTVTSTKGTILLIHGFPLTHRQFRHVIGPLTEAGYRVIAPDYTGAGGSSKPEHDYTKAAIASDLHELLKQLGIRKVHVVAHDIGSMIGNAYAWLFPNDTLSATLGECPLPGTTQFEEDKAALNHFHVNFHSHPDLAVALISGKEEFYLRYFFDNQAYHRGGITDDDVAAFARAYSQPGALRAACLTYAAFGQDLQDNKAALKEQGLLNVPAYALGGAKSHHAGRAGDMIKQLYKNVEVKDIEETGHYLAMESPKRFAEEVLRFVGQHQSP